MFLAALAFSVGIIAGNRPWRAPHIWLIACVIAAMGVCVLLGSSNQESVDVAVSSSPLDWRSRFICSGRHSADDFLQARGSGGPPDAGADSALPVHTYCERLHFSAKLRTPQNYGNPGALDLAGYLASQGVRPDGSARASLGRDSAWLRRQPHRAVARAPQCSASHPAALVAT